MARSKKETIKRLIRIKGTGQELQVSKVTSVNVSINMIHLDQLLDGTWRLTYNENLIPDLTAVEALEIVRM